MAVADKLGRCLRRRRSLKKRPPADHASCLQPSVSLIQRGNSSARLQSPQFLNSRKASQHIPSQQLLSHCHLHVDLGCNYLDTKRTFDVLILFFFLSVSQLLVIIFLGGSLCFVCCRHGTISAL